MKILVDENVPRMTVAYLRDCGHDVQDVRGTEDQGAEDIDLWRIAQNEERLLITTDKGFAAYRAVTHDGILIVRLRHPNRAKIHHAVAMAMDRYPDAEWPRLLVVVRDTTISASRPSGPAER